MTKHHAYLLSRCNRGGFLKAGYLSPCGWGGDPMVIEDHRLRLDALRAQSAPRLP